MIVMVGARGSSPLAIRRNAFWERVARLGGLMLYAGVLGTQFPNIDATPGGERTVARNEYIDLKGHNWGTLNI